VRPAAPVDHIEGGRPAIRAVRGALTGICTAKTPRAWMLFAFMRAELPGLLNRWRER
jgi:hypothetical protein